MAQWLGRNVAFWLAGIFGEEGNTTVRMASMEATLLEKEQKCYSLQICKRYTCCSTPTVQSAKFGIPVTLSVLSRQNFEVSYDGI